MSQAHADLVEDYRAATAAQPADCLDAELEEFSVENGHPPTEESLPAAIPLREAGSGEPIAWLLDRLVLEDLNMFAGDGGQGKTTLLLAVLGAIAAGAPAFNTFGSGRSGRPVLLVSEEDGESVLRNRLEALTRGHGWSLAAVLENVHVLALAGARLDDLAWQLHLVAEARRVGAAAVGFDPLTDLMTGDDGKNHDAKSVIQFFRSLVRQRIAVLVTHHVTKPAEGVNKIHRVRGASSWFNAARAVWWCEARDTGYVLECLKLSRAERPKPIALHRSVAVDAANEAVWREAKIVTITDAAAAGLLGDAELAVLEALARSINNPNVTELRNLVRGRGLSNPEIDAARDGLRALDYVNWESGANRAKIYSITESGRLALARAKGGQ